MAVQTLVVSALDNCSDRSNFNHKQLVTISSMVGDFALCFTHWGLVAIFFDISASDAPKDGLSH
jgi:hypothetical protein